MLSPMLFTSVPSPALAASVPVLSHLQGPHHVMVALAATASLLLSHECHA